MAMYYLAIMVCFNETDACQIYHNLSQSCEERSLVNVKKCHVVKDDSWFIVNDSKQQNG